MSTENLLDRVYVPTQPFDSTDPPRFSQLSETAKDSFASELRKFFDYKEATFTSNIEEVPSIQKFALGSGTGEDSLETMVTLLMAYSDFPDKFPMISITSTSGRERKLNIGSNFVASVQYPPSVVGSEVGPFNFVPLTGEDDPLYIEFLTYPNGSVESETTSRISFSSYIFSDLSNVTMDEVVEQVNKSQALYYTLSKTSLGYLRIETGGVCARAVPNSIEITGGSARALTLLGLSIGDSDDYLSTSNPPRNRYGLAGDMIINIDVVTDDINTRTELQDLVYEFFTFNLEKRRFQFFGRSYWDRDLSPEEWFHIVFNNQFSWSSEVTMPKQGGLQHDQVYAIRGSVPIFIEDFVDRKIINEPVFLLSTKVNPVPDGFPTGDYGGVNWKNNL
jgi:hypothetical protein